MNKSFLQSEAWENFQKGLGRKTFRIDDILVIKMPMFLGQSYFYSPRCVFTDQKHLETFLDHAKKIAKSENTFFLRFEPQSDHHLNFDEFKKVKSRQPQETLIINLEKSADEILTNMKSKTRYNINLAQKKGVTAVISDNPKDIDIFFNIAEVTAARDKIRIFPKQYYENMAKTLMSNNMMKIYLAKYQDKYIAANLMFNFNDTFTYLHGASANTHRNVMAPYLLQWQAIQDAKKSGKKYYDFWGIAPLDVEDTSYKIQDTNHPWSGISRFKLGFAPNTNTGIYRQYPGCFEVSYGKKRYAVYSMFKKVL